MEVQRSRCFSLVIIVAASCRGHGVHGSCPALVKRVKSNDKDIRSAIGVTFSGTSKRRVSVLCVHVKYSKLYYSIIS